MLPVDNAMMVMLSCRIARPLLTHAGLEWDSSTQSAELALPAL